MNHELFETLGKVAGIGGISLGVLLVLFREIIRKKIFPSLTKEQAYKIIKLIIILVFSIALVGIGAWTFLEWNNSIVGHNASTINKEAIMHYQDGQTKLDLRTPASINDAILSFQKAITISPSYVEAYSGIADAYILLWGYEKRPPSQCYPHAKNFAQKGYSIDSLNPRMMTTMAKVELWINKDFSKAETLFKKALNADDSYAYTYVWYSQCLTFQNKHEEAIKLIREGEKKVPTSRILKAVVAWNLYYASQFKEAEKQALGVLKEDDNFYQANRYLGKIYLHNKEFSKALTYFNKAGNNVDVQVGKLRCLIGLNDTNAASALENEIVTFARTNYVPPYELAKLAMTVGDKKKAMELIWDTYNENDGFILWIKIEPSFKELSTMNKFKTIENAIFGT